MVPNLLKNNIIMPPIIHIIQPLLAVIMTGEILSLLELHLLPILFLVGGMIGHFVEYFLGTHQFGNKPVISGTVYFEMYSPHILLQVFSKSKWLTIHVTVNMCPGEPLWPIFSLLCEKFPIHTVLV